MFLFITLLLEKEVTGEMAEPDLHFFNSSERWNQWSVEVISGLQEK